MSLDIRLYDNEDNEVYAVNVTHNLGKMASEVSVKLLDAPYDDESRFTPTNLYTLLWRPEELGFFTSSHVLDALLQALPHLVVLKSELQQHNPSNGWGNYDILLKVTCEYISACADYPNTTIHISR